MNRQYSNFPYLLHNKIKDAVTYYKENKFKYKHINLHQYISSRYIAGKITNSNVRGVLLFHDMGSGKTRCLIETASLIGNPTICIMASALMNNFKSNIENYERMTHKSIAHLFKYVSLDAYNMYEQMYRIMDSSKMLGKTTIIVDEAHEFFSKIANINNKNAPKLYDLLINSPDIKIIFASGTPFWKDPIELVPCFNMLAGTMIFPNSYKEFYDLFISSELRPLFADDTEQTIDTNIIIKTIINQNIIQNRIVGLVSYIPRDPSLFPSKKEPKIVHIPFDYKYQWSQYKVARISEIEEVKRSKMYNSRGASSGLARSAQQGSSTYRQKSRSYSNVAYDENKSIISPKGRAIVANIEAEPGKGIVYSQFKTSGIYVIARLLKEAGWTQLFEQPITGGNTTDNNDIDAVDNVAIGEINEEDIANDDGDDIMAEISKLSDSSVKEQAFSKTFAIYDGDTPTDVRQAIIDKYNEKNNMFGQHLRIILVTTIGTRGISLNCGLHAHVMEPYWYFALIQQFETRISRLNSHATMPADYRYTQLYVYLTTTPKEEDTKIWPETSTTDEFIYSKSISRQYILDEFLELIRETAIECSDLTDIVENVDKPVCKMCLPTNNQKLYTHDIYDDVAKLSNNCIPYVENDLEVKTIKYEELEYKYAVDHNSIYGYAIYTYDDKLRAYTKLGENTDLFVSIAEAITL